MHGFLDYPAGAANRDPRRWEDPNRFDVTRRAFGHLPFGFGTCGCGDKRGRLDNSICGFESRPVKFHAPLAATRDAWNHTPLIDSRTGGRCAHR